MLQTSTNEISYAGFTANKWQQVIGIDHDVCQRIISRIKSEVDVTGYSIWVYGGVLENWATWDIDMSLIGEFNRHKVRNIMSNVVKIGFEEGVYIDLKYQFHDEPIDFDYYLNNGMEPKVYKFAELDDIFINNGKKVVFQGDWEGPLFIKNLQLPLDKQISKYKYNNYIYQKAKQIV